MNLPNYFLADLPPEATFSPAMMEEACRALKRNREQYLAGRSTASLVRLLADVADNWLQSDYPFRQLALAEGPAATGFGAATLAAGLDGFFREITADKLNALIVQDLGHAQRLDSPAATPAEMKAQRAALATGPELIFHIAGGRLPNPALLSLILGLLSRSAQVLKCPTGGSFLPRLFAHSLYETDHKLGACLEIAEWRGGAGALEAVLFQTADCVTATGGDELLVDLRGRIPAGTRFLGYGHRVSFGYVTADAAAGNGARRVAAAAAADVVAWDQLGCLSPHVIYVETGAGHGGELLAELLAVELERRETVEPRGVPPPESAATIASRRGLYEVRAAHSPDTRHWASANSTAWTVVYEADPRFQVACLHRFIYVKPVRDLAEALQSADAVRGRVSTVGLAAAEEQASALAAQLGRWGVTRVCPLGRMQQPPLAWRHDGRPALADLVSWTDWEQ